MCFKTVNPSSNLIQLPSFLTHDGLKLVYRYDRCLSSEKAILIWVHGLNEHMGRYDSVIENFLNEYSSYRFDLRGHGASPGKRSHASSIDELVLDVKTFIDFVSTKEPQKKIFLIGHSMGGQLVLNQIGKFGSGPLSGFITSSPNIQIAFHLGEIKRFFGRFANAYFPKMPLPNHVKAQDLSHDENVIRLYNSDALVNKTLTAGLGYCLVKNQEDEIMQYPPKITLPAFMMHSGDDKVCAKEGSIRFFENLASQDKTLKIYEGAYHELFNDFVRDEVFHDMHIWLKKHL